MLIYVKNNFNYISYYKINMSNCYFKLFSIFKMFSSINTFYFVNLFTNSSFTHLHFFFLNIFFKNQFFLFNKMIKKFIFRFSYKKFIVNSFISDKISWNLSFNFSNIYSYLSGSSFFRVVVIKKLNILKFQKLFKFLSYWLPLKLLSYYSLTNNSFGYKKNFINELHWLVLMFRNHRYILKHHL